jgi:hypothetical protein
MKSFLSLSLGILFTLSLTAQVGIGTTTPEAALDIDSTTDGLLIPRVALTSTTILPVGFLTPTVSELVYNTATTGDVTPGFYYLSTVTGPWVRLAGAVSGTNWEILGNANIVEGTNFMGTTTNTDVAFRRNSSAAGRISATSTSFGLGAQATAPSSTAITAIGYNALNNNLAGGILNTALGYRALETNSLGDNNTAIGYETLLNNTGTGNTGVGGAALNRNLGADFNTAVGFTALYSNTTGNNSTAVGYGALVTNTGGADNTAVGFKALEASTGFQNVGLGFQALRSNTGGSANIGIGWNAGAANAGANNNIAIGYEAMISNRASNNLAIGFQAMRANQVSPDNTAIGFQAMSQLNDAASRNNLAVGFQAMQSSAGNMSGNSFFGSLAGRNNTGDFCTGIGMRALGSRNAGPTSGVFNTAVGYQALSFNTTGQQNTGIGVDALFATTTGNFNTALGFKAGSGLSSGSSNTMLGYETGNSISTGTNNTAIGFQAQVPSATGSNQLSIGNWIYGNAGNIGIGVLVPTEKLEVAGKIRAVDVNFSGLPVYADEAAAIAGGIATGDLYQTPTGEIRIKL